MSSSIKFTYIYIIANKILVNVRILFVLHQIHIFVFQKSGHTSQQVKRDSDGVMKSQRGIKNFFEVKQKS